MRTGVGVRVVPWAAFGLTVGLLWGHGARAQGAAAVPADRQVQWFKKVFNYDRSLRAGDGLEVVVLTPEPTTPEAEAVAKAFQTAGLRARVAKVEPLVKEAPTLPRVLYLMPGAATPEVASYAERYRLLTLGGAPEMVQAAQAVVGLEPRADGSPRLLIHLGRAKANGHVFSSELLGVARVFR